MKTNMALSLSLAALTLSLGSLAQAAQIECNDLVGEVRISATVKDEDIADKSHVSVELFDVRLYVDSKHTLTGATVDEEASGGAQWDSDSVVVVARGNVIRHIVALRLEAWDQNGIAKGYFELGKGASVEAAICQYTK